MPWRRRPEICAAAVAADVNLGALFAEVFNDGFVRCDGKVEGQVRALLIDDSSTMRSILRMILRKAGFETFEAGHGEEGLRQLELYGVMDLALVDWNMPEMNGFEFLCKVRENPAYAQMSIVMVTTETELSQVQNALHHGANEYIMKPFTKDSVLDKLLLLGILPQTI